MNRALGNFTGAFADGAILFPLIIALSAINGFNLYILLLTAGIFYIFSGIFFKIPMAVQPLKSIAIAAITIGATFNEVRVSGILLGISVLAFYFFNLNSFFEKVPKPIIHGIQVGLGVLLILKGIESGFIVSSTTNIVIISTSLLAILFFSKSSIPLLGIVALGGFLFSLTVTGNISQETQSFENIFRPWMILSLLIPQLILTTANSVIATTDVSRRYFGEKANRVTPKRLITSIGIGNIFSGLLGGLPFCHGSGGITAHYRGGSRDWWSNLIIGTTLIILAIIEFFVSNLGIFYPPVLLGILLMATGFFHIQLAAPSWNIKSERLRLAAMGIVTLLTHNLLWTLLIGIAPEIINYVLKRTKWMVSHDKL